VKNESVPAGLVKLRCASTDPSDEGLIAIADREKVPYLRVLWFWRGRTPVFQGILICEEDQHFFPKESAPLPEGNPLAKYSTEGLLTELKSRPCVELVDTALSAMGPKKSKTPSRRKAG
jgi:hypothetical protein